MPEILYTANDLLDILEKKVEKWTEDMVFHAQPVAENDISPDDYDLPDAGEQKIQVFKNELPEKGDLIRSIPYIILSHQGFRDDKNGSVDFIRFMIGIYNPQKFRDGTFCTLNGVKDVTRVAQRLRVQLQKEAVFGAFSLMKQGEYGIEFTPYTPETPPYYFGDMTAAFLGPEVERDLGDWKSGFFM